MTAVRRFVTRPQHVEAVRFDGTKGHAMQIGAWVRGEDVVASEGLVVPGSNIRISIDTPRGPQTANAGDWIVRSLEAGFFTVIPGESFERTFQETL